MDVPNLMSPTERRALEYAIEMHGDQRYGSHPYVKHLVDVWHIAMGAPPSIYADEAMGAATLLHDVLEDTDATHEELAVRFGTNVADLVEAVTGRGDRRHDQVWDAYRKIIAFGPRAAYLKLCDRTANGEAARDSSPAHLKMYQREQFDFLRTLTAAGMVRSEEPWSYLLGRLAAALR